MISGAKCQYSGCANEADRLLSVGGDSTLADQEMPICADCARAMWEEICKKGMADRVNWIQRPLSSPAHRLHPSSQQHLHPHA